MAIRSSMVNLVSRLRSVTGAAPDDVFQGVTYWTDEQLQAALDAAMYPAWATKLTAKPEIVNGNRSYRHFTFAIPRGYWLEEAFTFHTESGSAVSAPSFVVQVNDKYGNVTFSGDTGYSRLSVDCNVIDWNAAAAWVWEQKAAHRFDYVDFKAGDHQFKASQEYNNCVQRAAHHRARKIRMFDRPVSGFSARNQNLGERWD